jgi:DNA-binding GntR family transcriptional regulator
VPEAGSRSDSIARSIRGAIVSGQLKPGERLVEDSIAEEHQVSRVPVREALRRLEAEGFVTLTPFRGAAVAVPSSHEGLQLLTVRRGLEVMAARLAAERRGAGYEDAIATAVKEEAEAARRHYANRFLSLSLRFHELVRLAAGNEQLVLMLERLMERIAWVFVIDLDERASSAAADHAAIAKAILGGNPVQAGYLMDEHVVQDEVLYRAKAYDQSTE